MEDGNIVIDWWFVAESGRPTFDRNSGGRMPPCAMRGSGKVRKHITMYRICLHVGCVKQHVGSSDTGQRKTIDQHGTDTT